MAETVKQKLQKEIAELKRQIEVLRGGKTGKYLYISVRNAAINMDTNMYLHEIFGALEYANLRTRCWQIEQFNKADAESRGDKND